MSFKNARIRLTFIYLVIVMMISVAFSVIIYSMSFNEIKMFNRTQTDILHGRTQIIKNLPPEFSFDEFDNLRTKQLADLKYKIIRNLVATNLLILIMAGLASFFLAKMTLKPIEEMFDLQNRFTADASHELRTPLSAMKLEIEVALRDKKLNESQSKKVLKSNLEEIDKLEKLSNALLQLAQYQSGQTKLQFENILTKIVVGEALDRVRINSDNKKIKIISKIETKNIFGDQASLIQLMTIFLDNAIKYSKNGSTINVNIFEADKMAVIRVKDKGIGIMALDLPHIFDRFYRADQSRSKEKNDGYGLGLSIAKQIIDMHSGLVNVESSPVTGTIFTVKIPLRKISVKTQI